MILVHNFPQSLIVFFKQSTLQRLEECIIIYADRLVDIIYEGIVEIKDESDFEVRFKKILETNTKYGKNDIATQRYFSYHDEIQRLMV